ncbi:MAG: hypothetical protein K8I02_11130, partial [Candidatus Methylomirabilis sp.]|nr:hypothetical protein [Deltaproteobacteria bacterium]
MGKIRKFRLRDGDRIDSYAVVGDQSLGNGWEAEVYKVREVATAAIRAIKLVRRDTGTFSDWIHRAWFYEQLARTGSTVRYYHMGEWYLDGYEHVTYFVLEYLNGTTLKSWAKPKRRPSALDRVRMLSLLAGKIEVVHKRDFA